MSMVNKRLAEEVAQNIERYEARTGLAPTHYYAALATYLGRTADWVLCPDEGLADLIEEMLIEARASHE